MPNLTVDIIVPVWNHPVATRHCLASVVANSENFRLILLDLCSEPDTEQVLHDFADYLDDRAILLRSERTIDYVEAINGGLSRSNASLKVLLSTSTCVTPGWLELLREGAKSAAAGILVPRIVTPQHGSAGNSGRRGVFHETDHGSFAAMALTAELYGRIHGFDCGLAGDLLCLKDYSRRACQAGFRTLQLNNCRVISHEDDAANATARRTRALRMGQASYTARWGAEQQYVAILAAECTAVDLAQYFGDFLCGARQGHGFHVLAPGKLVRKIIAAGFDRLHDAIAIERLPRFFAERFARRVCARLRSAGHEPRLLSGDPGLCSLSGETAVPCFDLRNSLYPVEV
jgi:glycosyltransferase involved in cell wall biosynthesis